MAQPVVAGQFDRFWAAYPRRVAKQDALKAWGQIAPSVEMVDAMVTALGWQTQLPDWTKDRGRYIPYPASWLRGRRWEDECTPQAYALVSDRTRENLANVEAAVDLIQRGAFGPTRLR